MRFMLKLSAAAAALALAAPAAAGPKPTIVLVHGAFADSSSWSGVIADLERDGYPVVAAANPLRGIASDAAYVASLSSIPDGSARETPKRGRSCSASFPMSSRFETRTDPSARNSKSCSWR